MREIVAIERVSEAEGWQRSYARKGQPLAMVTLRGGVVLSAFRCVEELRDDWERSLIFFDTSDFAFQ